jgi:stage II sporulation protein E
MDITILDLFTGTIRIMKNGACNTYIKNKKNIQVVKSSENPIGILEKIELNETEHQISDGSIIVMCSDGVLESKENYNKDWIEEFLKNISTNNVQKIADMVLAEAIDNSYGIANDDMTVIVAKIIKRK